MDCPDCGGSGLLPSRSVHVDWRARDIERALTQGQLPQKEDVKWLLTELHTARRALTDVVALAHDVVDADSISMRIRSVANVALGLYDLAPDAGTPRTGDPSEIAGTPPFAGSQ